MLKYIISLSQADSKCCFLFFHKSAIVKCHVSLRTFYLFCLIKALGLLSLKAKGKSCLVFPFPPVQSEFSQLVRNVRDVRDVSSSLSHSTLTAKKKPQTVDHSSFPCFFFLN